MDCKEALRWYEQRWEEDRQRWIEEKKKLEKRLEEQAEEILKLKNQLEACKGCPEKQKVARERCENDLDQAKKQLQNLSRPVLGEGFFRYLAQATELWDQVLIREARELRGTGLEPWLKGIWREREEALSRALAGETPDWRRIRTGLVLEWALLTWLEGIRGG